jgi:hypothetical protein
MGAPCDKQNEVSFMLLASCRMESLFDADLSADEAERNRGRFGQFGQSETSPVSLCLISTEVTDSFVVL